MAARGEQGDRRRPNGLVVLLATAAAGAAAFASRVMDLESFTRIAVMFAVLALVALMVGLTRQRYPTEHGTTGWNPAVNALLGAFLAGTAAGAIFGWAWLGAWPDAPSVVMYLAMLGLGVMWLVPWLFRRPSG